MALVAFGTGCASSSNPGRVPSGDRREPNFPNLGNVGDGSWPFWPQRVRVHPLTQFVTDRKTGHELLEVRIEFFDGWGHTCKAFGGIVIEIYDAKNFDAKAAVSWSDDHELDLANLQINSERYDDVTRTYLFSLEVEDQPIPEDAELRVYFQSGDGARLQAAYLLPGRQP